MRKLMFALAFAAGGAGNAFGQMTIPSSAWEFNTPADAPICQIDGTTPQGHVVLRAAGDTPDVVRLVLTKRTWRIPNGTTITALMTFSEGSILRLAGRGEDTSVVFDLTAATLKPWLHGWKYWYDHLCGGKRGAVDDGPPGHDAGGERPLWVRPGQQLACARSSRNSADPAFHGGRRATLSCPA